MKRSPKGKSKVRTSYKVRESKMKKTDAKVGVAKNSNSYEKCWNQMNGFEWQRIHKNDKKIGLNRVNKKDECRFVCEEEKWLWR